MKYTVKGYTGRHPDFTTEIDVSLSMYELQLAIDGASDVREASLVGEFREELKEALLNSDCDSDYLNLFDDQAYQWRDDLAAREGQGVAIAESDGCDNCQLADGGGSNDYREGCNDEPHGPYMLTFEEVRS